MKEIIKLFFGTIILFMMISSSIVNAAPTIRVTDCAYTIPYTFAQTDWTGKQKITYKNESIYSVANEAVKWSNLGLVSIFPTLVSDYDVRIANYSQVDNIYGYTNFLASVIAYNNYYFKSMNSYQRTYTILHEFGHALGLDERNVVGHNTVMRQGNYSQTNIGSHDIATYNCHWGK
ncbi:MAG: hypothetical protein PHI05_01625 [Bacilli bacterium]|nr:hypothetical protein [Bacilli bacterium]MDD4547427.1 hypothetical protein [Bacilli bacterium]